MGLEALIGPMLGKLVAGFAAAAALIAVYFGIKHKGAAEQRQRDETVRIREQAVVQARVDDARTQDAAVDARTRARLAEISQATPAPPPAGAQPGDRFKFVWILLVAGSVLMGCTAIAPAVPGVRVEIPPRPTLPMCLETPHPTGSVIRTDNGMAVVLPMEDAQAVAAYLRTAPGCWQAREALLEGHVTKVENRLRALGGGP